MALPVMTIDGDVVAVHSHWTADGSRIVTEATVRTPDGDVVVSQLGGTVDGIAMRQMPGPELLVLGMTVAVAAHRGLDASQREHVVLDSAKVVAYPPGFVRTGPTKGKKYLFWESGCVYINVDSAGTSAMPIATEIAVVDASIASWNDDTASCSYLKLINAGRKASEVGRDNVNLIKFRDTVWGRPAIGDDAERLHEPSAAAITTAIYIDDVTSDRDGAILDADIELNNVDFKVTVDPEAGNGRNSVLQNTLTHELGHLQGLEHPCRVGDDPPRTDGAGNPVPTCGEAQSPPLTPAKKAILEATMFNFQSPGETSKESLSDDDIAAICAIYPIADDPGTCDPAGANSGGCCSASGQDDRTGVSFLLAGMTLMLVMRRRKTSPNA